MRRSEFFIPMMKETPKDATIQSHILMLRAGLVFKQGSGLYGYLPYGFQILEKVHRIIQEEIVATGANETYLNNLVPQSLWDMTGRFEKMGSGVFSLRDRHNNGMVLCPTHEESMVDMLKNFVTSYKQTPLNLFHITKKFRDEIRPRYGVMRGREFIMMDGYTFHLDLESLDEYYMRYRRAYQRIFVRMGLDALITKADSGDMGGDGSEEFMVPSTIGDDTIYRCDACSYVANEEKASFIVPKREEYCLPIGEVETPQIKTIQTLADYMKCPTYHTAKTIVYKTEDQNWVICMLPGDRMLHEVKLKNLLKGTLLLNASAEDVETSIGPVGFLGPKNLVTPAGATIVVDPILLQGLWLVGMNKKDFHYSGYSFEEFRTHDFLSGDISVAQTGDICPQCQKGHLKSFSGIEVGHIFKLGQDYSQKMNWTVLDQQGKPVFLHMGCYGIGVDRVFATIIEQYHDAAGIILPLSVSPYQVILISIGQDLNQDAQELYQMMSEKYVVLWDDRPVSPGIKFNEADLMGVPIRVTMGKSWKEDRKLSVKKRVEQVEMVLSVDETQHYINHFIEEESLNTQKKLDALESLS